MKKEKMDFYGEHNWPFCLFNMRVDSKMNIKSGLMLNNIGYFLFVDSILNNLSFFMLEYLRVSQNVDVMLNWLNNICYEMRG